MFATLSCYAAFVVLGISAALFGPAYASLATRFGIDLKDAAIFTSLQYLGASVSLIIGGRLLDRFNVRYLLPSGMILFGGGLLALTFAVTLPLGLMMALVIGVGYGVIAIAPNFVVATLNPTRSGAALNLLNFFYSIGAVAGPQLVTYTRQNSFAFTGIAALIIAAPMAFVSLRPQPRASSAPARVNWLAIVPFAALLFLYTGTEVGFSSWIPTQLYIVAGAAEATAANGTSLFWIGMAIGRFMATFALRRVCTVQLMALALTLIAICVGVVLAFPTVEGVTLIGALVVGMACGPIFPSTLAIVNSRFPEARGAASGTVIAVGVIGAVVLPWVQGQVGGGVNGGMIVPLIAAVLMFSILFATARTRQERQPA